MIIEEETKIEEVTAFDEVLIQTNNIVDLGITNSIETINYSTPFDELPITKPIENQKEEKIEEIKELEVEHISFENEVSFNPTQEVEIIPLEDESDKFFNAIIFSN